MFNMNQCSTGDKLLTTHGLVVTYKGINEVNYPYRHEIEYADGAYGTRCDDGSVFSKNKLDTDEDIIGFANKVRGFHRTDKAWYSNAITEKEILFGMYSPEGGTTGEMSVIWETIGTEQVPRLHCYDDGWKVLASFTDVIQRLGEVDDTNITPDAFTDLLLSCGFKDITEYSTENV